MCGGHGIHIRLPQRICAQQIGDLRRWGLLMGLPELLDAYVELAQQGMTPPAPEVLDQLWCELCAGLDGEFGVEAYHINHIDYIAALCLGRMQKSGKNGDFALAHST